MSPLSLEGGHEVEKDVKRKKVQREVWVRGAAGGKEGVEDGVEEGIEEKKDEMRLQIDEKERRRRE